ncbi:MAG: hypothetical protein ABSE58_10900 [Candidatus Limnocylindrales bacterium]
MRLMQAVEGPIGSLKPTSQGWHVLGNGAADSFEATIVGIAMAPDGRRRLATRPNLSAQLARNENGTVISGQIRPRYPTEREKLLNRYVVPPMLVVLTVLGVMNPSGRPIFIGAIALSVGMFLAARASRRALGPSEEASEHALLAWLAQAVEGTPDTASEPS